MHQTRDYKGGVVTTPFHQSIELFPKEAGCNHSQSLGFSTDGFLRTHTMRKLNLIWVATRMHIEVYKYPAWSDVVEIETWCQGYGRIATRDVIGFLRTMPQFATGEVIGRATSKLVMMNQDTRRFQRLSDDIRDELLNLLSNRPLTFPEEKNKSLRKISKLEDPFEYSKLGLVPRIANLDMNVNNVTYIGWVLESVPQEITDTHELQTITLEYRHPWQVQNQSRITRI